uniref:BRMS1 like transcriptional repressor a n=1 Tax=Oncorhynchus kisutch TaxID=8019 RepID=A0A8C7H0B8_ONCKI
MPVHSREKKESNHEEMEVDYPEQDGSSSDEDDTESSSVSEDGDSSEMDDEDCERRRVECLDEMTNLEKQFGDLKDQLYKERLSQVDAKLQEVIAGKASEYLDPLANLQENMQIRTKVAGIYRELCIESVKNKYDCEIQAAFQHWESEKLLLFDTVQSELVEKIRRLEEDRHSIDITSELWKDELQSRKNKRKDPFSPDKKKKPVVVSDILFHHLSLNRMSLIFFLLQSWSVLCVYLSHPPHIHTCLYIHLYFLNIRTTIYCLHVTRLGYTGGLDSSQKGTMPRRCIVWSCSSVGRARIVGSIPDTTYTCICDCKSLWIKASAKCNLYYHHYYISMFWIYMMIMIIF